MMKNHSLLYPQGNIITVQYSNNNVSNKVQSVSVKLKSKLEITKNPNNINYHHLEKIIYNFKLLKLRENIVGIKSYQIKSII